MKSIFLPCLLFFLSFGVMAQNLDDQSKIAQACIELPELQDFFNKDIKSGTIPLIIIDNDIVPDSLNCAISGAKVDFMQGKELFFYNREDYLTFEKFSLTPTMAEVTISYYKRTFLADLVFEKENEVWAIKSKEVR